MNILLIHTRSHIIITKSNRIVLGLCRNNVVTTLVNFSYGWDVNTDGMFIPNWFEQDIIDYMAWQVEFNGMATAAVARSLNKRGITVKRGGKWQGNSITRTIGNDFHTNRLKFTAPDWWGSKPWHREAK